MLDVDGWKHQFDAKNTNTGQVVDTRLHCSQRHCDMFVVVVVIVGRVVVVVVVVTLTRIIKSVVSRQGSAN